MHPFRWPSAVVRFIVWAAVSMASTYMVRNPTPQLSELVADLPFSLLFTSLPGLLYLFLVRTWKGTWIAGAGIAVLQFALFAYLSEASKGSSTAGVGIIVLPVLLLFPIVGTYLWEKKTAPPRALPPPPEAGPTHP